MATSGAICGVVTGPVGCLVHGVSDNPSCLVALPISFILGPCEAWYFGNCKDVDYEEFGSYEKAGTFRIRLVFDPLKDFPKGPGDSGDDVYDGPEAVPPVRPH